MLTKPEIRQLSSKDMMDELQKSRRELLKAHFDIRMGTSKEVHVVKNLKHYIARLETIAKELKIEDIISNMGKAEANTSLTEGKKASMKKTSSKKVKTEKPKTEAVKKAVKEKKTKTTVKK